MNAEIYAAVEASDIAFKNKEYIERDLVSRFQDALISELRTGFSNRVAYSAAEKSRKELIDTMDMAMGANVIQSEHHMIKITVEVKAEIVSK